MRTSRATRADLAVATAITLAAVGCGSDAPTPEAGPQPQPLLRRRVPEGSTSRRWKPSGTLEVSVARFPTPEDAAQAQATLLDRFPATPVEEIDGLPMDVDRVLARVVGLPEGVLPRLSDLAVYGSDGWLHFDSHPARTEKIFEVTGTDRIAKASSNVYRTAGPTGAEILRDDFVGTTREMYPDLVEDETVPQSIPGTRCWSGDVAQGRASVCLMVYGRYMAELSGLRPVGNETPENDSLRTLSQRLATQYVKFVRSEEMGLGEN